MRGSIKWYLRCAIRTLLMSVIWGMIMWIFSSGSIHVSIEDHEIREIREIIYYIILGEVIFSFSTAISFYKRDIPLAISMGASRKNAFLGTCFFNLLSFLIVLVLAVAAGSVLGDWKSLEILGAVVCVVWASVFGTFLSILYQLFGRVVAIIGCIVLWLLFMAGFIFFGMCFEGRMAIMKMLEDPAGVYAGIAAVTVLVWGGVMLLHYRTVQKVTV